MWKTQCNSSHFSYSVQLDPLSYELNDYLENEIQGLIMSLVQKEKKVWFAGQDIFEARKQVVHAFNGWFAEMMWGIDWKSHKEYLPMVYQV